MQGVSARQYKRAGGVIPRLFYMGDQAAAGSAHDEGEGLLFRFDSGVSHHIREPQGSLQTVEKVQPMLGFFHYLCYNNHG